MNKAITIIAAALFLTSPAIFQSEEGKQAQPPAQETVETVIPPIEVNRKCGMCHTDMYATIKKWNVRASCELCHGPGQAHMEKVINLPAELTTEEFTKEIKGTIISFDKPHESGFHDYVNNYEAFDLWKKNKDKQER
jgi:hypothetical protein